MPDGVFGSVDDSTHLMSLSLVLTPCALQSAAGTGRHRGAEPPGSAFMQR